MPTEIKGINGYPIVVDADGIEDGAVGLDELDTELKQTIPMSPLTNAEIDAITDLTE